MDAPWIDVLISGASGVLGAFVGASAALWMHRREMHAAEAAERKAALVAFYAAVNKLGLFMSVWASLQPNSRFLRAQRVAWRTYGFQKSIVARQWAITDDFWTSSGRARAVATAEELAVVDELENVIGAWPFGEPIPDEWAPAIQKLRSLMENADLPAPPPKV
jgi:hypothetical protein